MVAIEVFCLASDSFLLEKFITEARSYREAADNYLNEFYPHARVLSMEPGAAVLDNRLVLNLSRVSKYRGLDYAKI